MNATPALLQMRQIRKAFGGIEVLHGVDFDLHAGEVHALVGHNGAGKSTLMKVLAGLYDDYQGQVSINGQICSLASPDASLAAGIAVIHQEFALVPQFTAAENFALGHEPARARGLMVDRARMCAEAEALLDKLGFDLPCDVPVGRLSVAHQQLTEVAKAMSRRARILIMDEPTARLAPAEREALFRSMRRLQESGVGIVYISHFLEEVLQVSDRVTVLRDGHRIETSPASAFDLNRLTTQIVGAALAESSAKHAGDRSSAWPAQPRLELEDFGQIGRQGSTLSVRAGEIVGLAGLTGSGRTSLSESMCGARRNHGTLRVDGQPLRLRSTADGLDHGIVLLPEDRKRRGLVMASGVGSNIVLAALRRQFSSAGFVQLGARRAAISDAISRLTIRGATADKPVRALSGGNQQKVLIARAALNRPRVLVLDQPTAGVDIGAKNEIYGHIRSMAADGVACVVASDELEELLLLCDRIAIMRGGKVVDMLDARTLTQHELLAQMSHGEVSA
ncbi:sugar ABC transporter ATP-binding protein [Paraburkholderia sp. HP33-1]|uniref:sugar ABC transporter ATP-binding protein n=1 Tax=Paraburkholderia sp. HP33-1 TaxID=2883243 RepID=UPI001F22033A|nr:sugar ABC transporter ATP-binding protein [Paraburkholderia sp. HP33-1]